MWFDPDAPPSQNGETRHEANQNDRLSSYGWLRHDGVGYGVQQIRDKDYNISLSVVGCCSAQAGSLDWICLRCCLAQRCCRAAGGAWHLPCRATRPAPARHFPPCAPLCR
jgi:hypothetical protein